ncbi:hypothetical protein M942_24515 [Enterobacter ludwigii]|nr:hypothetical protein M942_24515 [Enterobacter ludwigii]
MKLTGPNLVLLIMLLAGIVMYYDIVLSFIEDFSFTTIDERWL